MLFAAIFTPIVTSSTELPDRFAGTVSGMATTEQRLTTVSSMQSKTMDGNVEYIFKYIFSRGMCT